VNFDANESWVEKLVEAGFDRSAKAVFVLEGLTYYLSQKENEVVFAGAASVAAPGSSLVLDMVNGDFMREQNSWHLQDLRERGCGWLWGSNDPEGVLASHGFAATVFDLDHLSVVRSRGAGKPPSIRAVPSPRGRIHGGGPRRRTAIQPGPPGLDHPKIGSRSRAYALSCRQGNRIATRLPQHALQQLQHRRSE